MLSLPTPLVLSDFTNYTENIKDYSSRIQSRLLIHQSSILPQYKNLSSWTAISLSSLAQLSSSNEVQKFQLGSPRSIKVNGNRLETSPIIINRYKSLTKSREQRIGFISCRSSVGRLCICHLILRRLMTYLSAGLSRHNETEIQSNWTQYSSLKVYQFSSLSTSRLRSN